MSDELLTPKERSELFEKYELEDPCQVSSFEGWLIEAQLAKARPIIEKQGFARGIAHYRRVILPTMVEEAIKQERGSCQQHMKGFPHSLYPISEKCLCLKWDCRWFQLYSEPNEKEFPIGWCRRYEPDPDAGYVIAFRLPPCVVWAVERQALKSS